MSQSKILCIGNGWFPLMPGGLNRYVYESIHHLSQLGSSIEFCGVGIPNQAECSLSASIQLTNLCDSKAFLVHRLLSAWRYFANRKVAPCPDAINLHFALYGLPILSILPAEIPITFTFHGPWALEGQQESENRITTLLKHWIEQQVYQRCDRFIVLSRAFGEVLHQHYQIPWSKIYLIPGGVDTERFQPRLTQQAARQHLHWPSNRPILFTPRRLVPRMGLDQLLTALVQVRQQIPDVWLAIAGRGPLQTQLQQQCRDAGLSDTVQFLGFLPDDQLPIAYQAANLTVVPSQALEGFGLVVLESLACGTPVVCTPVGGMPEILQPFAPQLLIPDTTVHAIATHLVAALSGELLLPSSTDCRAYVKQHFDWHSISQQIQQVLLQSGKKST
ncbi:glycosyltransferase family 4 protein [Thermocoleostomius sinensis]|uniref:Glycosyltransferase family 4 protein n=1 Tax=Thermocoleostomius sinensis A174 TaxID=2016057 RepID=A0A9E8Z9Q9_9CYAN|nr:glycosyltransferase family 4 protein [Thermocoleostomius sinensis]WAL59154.1 glycosyltransferase family 4 protein [Thermocoleostomius sinensis A174]